MNIDDYNRELVRKLQRLPAELQRYMSSRVGVDATAVIKRRVIQTGIAADGTPFSPYSTKPTLAGASSFLNKTKANAYVDTLKSQGGLVWFKKKTKSGKKVNLFLVPGGYRDIRAYSGLQVQHKSFLFRNFMWRSVKVRNSQATQYGAEVTIGPQEGKEALKMQGHNEREGKPLLMLSLAEKKIIEKNLEIWINNYFK